MYSYLRQQFGTTLVYNKKELPHPFNPMPRSRIRRFEQAFNIFIIG
jgi:hypothetical protein